MLRTSERTTLKKCEWLWDRTYNDRLKPYSDAPALRFGSLVHRALAAWYVPGVKRGTHPAVAFEEEYEKDQRENEEIFGLRVGNGDVDEKWENARELGIAMMNNYVDEYGNDDRWEVLATEMPFKVLISRDGKPWFYYTGIIDGLWRHRSDKKIWIPDHKTTSGIGGKNWSHLVLDDQAGSYWSFGVDYLRAKKLLGPRQRLAGMLYNIMRKAMPDERASKFVNGKRLYLNKDGSISQKQPSPYFKRMPIFRDEHDRGEAMARAEVDFARIEMFKSGELPMTKNPGMFTCPMCSMRDACELHETGNDYLGFLKQTTQQWAPYSEHEIYEGR